MAMGAITSPSSHKYKETKSRVTTGMLKNARKELVMNINSVAVAEVMNDYFSSVFTRKDDNNHVEMMPEMGEVCFTRWKVRKRVRKLRAMTAAGLDGIGPKDLQELEKKSVDGLTMILKGLSGKN